MEKGERTILALCDPGGGRRSIKAKKGRGGSVFAGLGIAFLLLLLYRTIEIHRFSKKIKLHNCLCRFWLGVFSFFRKPIPKLKDEGWRRKRRRSKRRRGKRISEGQFRVCSAPPFISRHPPPVPSGKREREKRRRGFLEGEDTNLGLSSSPLFSSAVSPLSILHSGARLSIQFFLSTAAQKREAPSPSSGR